MQARTVLRRDSSLRGYSTCSLIDPIHSSVYLHLLHHEVSSTLNMKLLQQRQPVSFNIHVSMTKCGMRRRRGTLMRQSLYRVMNCRADDVCWTVMIKLWSLKKCCTHYASNILCANHDTVFSINQKGAKMYLLLQWVLEAVTSLIEVNRDWVMRIQEI